MISTRIRAVMTGIERFLDLMPEPLVLRALEAPDRTARPRR